MSLVDKLKEVFEPQNREHKEAMQKKHEIRLIAFGKLAISVADKAQSKTIQELLHERRLLTEILAQTDLMIEAQANQNTLEAWKQSHSS